MSRLVMLCGNEAELLQTRQLLLEQAGFAVVSACSLDEIDALALNPAIELGVLGHSLSEGEQRNLARNLRAKWPGMKILHLTGRRISLEKIADDEYRSDSLQPGQFVADCRQILGA